MVFSSLLFLFRFLPIVLIAYYVCPKRFRNAVLFLLSLVFYAWGEPVYVVLMLFSTLVDYTHGLLAEKYLTQKNTFKAKCIVASSVIINLALLGFFKYADFLIGVFNSITGLSVPLLELGLPIGISFYTFQTMSYTIDVYRKDAKAEKNIITFGCYVAMFPQLIAGPIVRFKTVAKQLKSRTCTLEKFKEGILRFTVGLGKKVLLANNAGLLWDQVFGDLAMGDITVLSAWLGIIAFAFQIYFDFSGYSDMAIGLGKIIGFEFEENFNYPYISKSITEFWRRWHISLGTWFREYVYIPLGGNRKHGLRNLIIVWLLTGVWHGANFNFMLWGIYYGLFLILEKYVIHKWINLWPKWIQHLYTLVIVLFGWILFAYEDISVGFIHLKSMFGIGTSSVAGVGIYYLYTNIVLILLLCIGSTSLPKRLTAILKNKKIYPVLEMVFLICIWILSIAYLVDATYNPFLYFRF